MADQSRHTVVTQYDQVTSTSVVTDCGILQQFDASSLPAPSQFVDLQNNIGLPQQNLVLPHDIDQRSLTLPHSTNRRSVVDQRTVVLSQNIEQHGIVVPPGIDHLLLPQQHSLATIPEHGVVLPELNPHQSILPPQYLDQRTSTLVLPQQGQHNIIPPQHNLLLPPQHNIVLPPQRNLALPQQGENIILPQQYGAALPQNVVPPYQYERNYQQQRVVNSAQQQQVLVAYGSDSAVRHVQQRQVTPPQQRRQQRQLTAGDDNMSQNQISQVGIISNCFFLLHFHDFLAICFRKLVKYKYYD